MKTLFKDENRDSKGRYATKEVALISKLTKENTLLKFNLEKERRRCEALAKRVIRLERDK